MVTAEKSIVTAVTPEPIMALATGFMAAKHLFIANEVGLFEHLAAGPRSLDDLATKTGVPRRTLRIVTDALVALGLLDCRDGQYQNGPAAATYLSGATPTDLRPVLRFFNHISYRAWLGLEAAVRSGEAQTKHGRFSDEEQRIFSAGVEAMTAGTAQALATTYEFGRHRRVLDLGGGTGSFLRAVLRRHGTLQATLFELPSVAPLARQRLAAEPATRQVAVVAGDFFQDPLPNGHDAIVVANVVHLFSPERNRALLGRLRDQVAAGARLLLVDFWTNQAHTEPLLAALLAGEFLVIAGEGDVYSEEEVRGWLEQTGWRFIGRTALAGASGLIVAEATS